MKKIAIIGASYLQVPLVLKAKEMGIETHCFAWADGAVAKEHADYFHPISIIEKEAILAQCREISIDGICTIASDVATPTVAYVADKMGLKSNSVLSALKSTNKYQMRKAFMDAGVNCPRFSLSSDIEAIQAMRFPLIVKPTDRSGSLGVRKIENFDELNQSITNAEDKSLIHTAIVEEYVTGCEVSVEVISWEGVHTILAITDKVTTGEPYFVELEHHQPSMLPGEIQNKIKAETIKALDALDIKFGASHAEFKITDNGDVYSIEVGARMGGDFIGSDLVFLSTGYDFLKGVIEVALGYFNKPIVNQEAFAGVYFLAKETEYIKDLILNANNDWIVKRELTSNELNNIQCSADRSGYILYKSDEKVILK